MSALAWYWRPVQWVVFALIIATAPIWLAAVGVYVLASKLTHKPRPVLLDMDNLP